MFIDEYINLLNEEKVKIETEPGALGLSLDAPIEKYKRKVTSGEMPWEELSKRVNTLYIYNKNKHPDVAEKARNIRNKLAAWVEQKRKNNPDFGK